MTAITAPDFAKLRKEYRVVPGALGCYRVFHGERELGFANGASIQSKAAARRLIEGDIRSRTLVQRATIQSSN